MSDFSEFRGQIEGDVFVKILSRVRKFQFGNGYSVYVEHWDDGAPPTASVTRPNMPSLKFYSLFEALQKGAELFEKSLSANCETEI